VDNPNFKMKIALASDTKKPSKISLRAGRAKYYLIYKNKKLIEIWKNPFSIGGGGAGWSVAKVLSDKNIDLVIAGRFGPNMEFALKQQGIKFKEAEGDIETAL